MHSDTFNFGLTGCGINKAFGYALDFWSTERV